MPLLRSSGPTLHAVHTTDGVLVCARCRTAATPWTRLRGLLGRDLPEGSGLHIRPTNAIHMFFMRYAIDAVFVDKEDRVVRVAAELRPWRMAACRGARSVIELPAGTAARAGLVEGARLQFTPLPEPT